MCGRYALYTLSQLVLDFAKTAFPLDLRPRYNIAPTQPVLVLPNRTPQAFEHVVWGLIPPWADPSIGGRLINARAETLGVKPAFRQAFRRRRCLVPADGFYEWRKGPGRTKTPMFVRMKSQRPFMLAGLWESSHGADGSEIRSCTIITGQPNRLVEPIHDRMPVILPPQRYEQWLDPAEKQPEELAELLVPYPSEEMEAFEVSPQINSPRAAPTRAPSPVSAGEDLFSMPPGGDPSA
jgi:putative SOS response-associated peptidase YedK